MTLTSFRRGEIVLAVGHETTRTTEIALALGDYVETLK